MCVNFVSFPKKSHPDERVNTTIAATEWFWEALGDLWWNVFFLIAAICLLFHKQRLILQSLNCFFKILIAILRRTCGSRKSSSTTAKRCNTFKSIRIGEPKYFFAEFHPTFIYRFTPSSVSSLHSTIQHSNKSALSPIMKYDAEIEALKHDSLTLYLENPMAFSNTLWKNFCYLRILLSSFCWKRVPILIAIEESEFYPNTSTRPPEFIKYLNTLQICASFSNWRKHSKMQKKRWKFVLIVKNVASDSDRLWNFLFEICQVLKTYLGLWRIVKFLFHNPTGLEKKLMQSLTGCNNFESKSEAR